MGRAKDLDVEPSKEPGLAWFPNGNQITKPAYNRLLVCASLFHEGAESRVGLHRRTGLPLSRLSDICGDLLRDGLIRESVVTPAGGTGQGRPQTLLEIDLRGLGVACVRYDRNHVVSAVADLAGTVRWQRRWDGPFSDDADRLLRRITDALGRAVAAAPKAGVRIVAAGAADPGTVNIASGRAVRAVNVPGWQNIPVVERLSGATGLPVVIERGDGWQALGEVAFGAGRGSAHAVFVTLLDGIGGGIVENGQLLTGRDGSAGEIGHTRVSEAGPPCGCGGVGCLEAHLAPARLAALWRGGTSDSDRPPLSFGEAPDDEFARMLRAAREGDGRAREILADAGLALARGLGNVVSLLNPERIILGGRFVEAGDLLLEPLKQALPRYTLRELLQGIEVRLAEVGESSTFLGIAAYVRERLFAYPSVGARFEGNGTKTPSLMESETKS
ncbi:ROK family protein [Singulisphaera acidiphila]|uniref:Transcriptional regulator/sugar kinase n=2 Tax=Singulisphaera acidiphila TaxID=466153 RepID=L0DQZ0_SINAD|nr:ROK family protein [Singulisphaera acidiphila]AGA31415.1 transcriptional regulator/sugar kinase [Singulisphaera acidiphila DSM 18658]